MKAKIQGDKHNVWYCVIYNNKILKKDITREYALKYSEGFNDAIQQAKKEVFEDLNIDIKNLLSEHIGLYYIRDFIQNYERLKQKHKIKDD